MPFEINAVNMAEKQKKLNIVMFNMSSYSEWQAGVSNRNWHVLNTLLSDEKIDTILAIDYLPHTFKRLARNFKENILAKPHDGSIFSSTFTSRTYKISEKLFVHSSVTSRLSLNKFYDELKNVIKKLGLEHYLVWSYYPLEIGYLSRLSADLKVFDAVDDWSLHASYQKQALALKRNYKKIDASADLIFTVTEELKSLFSNKEKVFCLPNAADLKHYQKEFTVLNRDIGDLPHPIIGYLGTIQDRLDLDLIDFLAKKNPASSIVLVGPVWHESIKEKLAINANVRFLGKKSYDEAPMYISQFDVAIVPHKTDAFSKTTNPMKIFDYLACGKPVVSTLSADLSIFGNLIYAANDYEEFNKMISRCLDEDKEINALKRREFVSEHSWQKRVEKMLEIIYQKL